MARPRRHPGHSIFPDHQWDEVATRLALSTREFELVTCVFDDLSEAEIAERLSISPHTVHQYMKRLYRKTGVTSRPQLIVRVVAEHLHLNPALPVGGLE